MRWTAPTTVRVGQEKLRSDVVYRGYFDALEPGRMSYSFFGGWALNRYLAVEVGYKDGGQFNGDIESDGAGVSRSAADERFVRSVRIEGFA